MTEYPVVHFQGAFYIFVTDDRRNGSLAPPEHFDGDGKWNIYHGMFSHSFALVENGEVWHYSKIIGNVSEIEFI